MIARRATRRTMGLGAPLVAVAALGLAACGDDDDDGAGEDIGDALQTIVTEGEEAVNEALDDATEAAVRNIAAQQGEEEFDTAGHPLDDEGLECEATVGAGGLNAVDVKCTGTTQEGEDATLNGGTTEMPGASITELEGLFAGTVGDTEVFSVEKLGG